MFADLEVRGKHVRRLHVFAALPLAAAVALGRATTHTFARLSRCTPATTPTASYAFALEIA